MSNEPREFIPLASGDPRLVSQWRSICLDAQARLDEWRAALRAAGIKAAHPNDGWVDREALTVIMVYPDFDDGAGVGDVIALGWPDNYRLAVITGRRAQLLSSGDKWTFEWVRP